MDKYIGAKLIQAEPERNPVTKEITGYKVVYPDGYESWSPKDVFEKAYMKVDDNKNLPSGVSIGPEMVDDFIASTETITMGETTTVVRCVLRNGFDIVESSSCVAHQLDQLIDTVLLEQVFCTLLLQCQPGVEKGQPRAFPASRLRFPA